MKKGKKLFFTGMTEILFRYLKLILVLLFLLMPVIAFTEEKAKTIDELSKMYDVSSCKECHKTIYEEWQKSIHARSLVGTGATMSGISKFATQALTKEWTYSGAKKLDDITVQHVTVCFKCHLPQIQNATDHVARQIIRAAIDGDEATLKKVGINCLVCHNSHAFVHKWLDGIPEIETVYGTKDGPHAGSPFKTLKRSPIIKEAIICGQCHGLGPNFDLPQPTQCATLYGSYLHAYIPSGGSKTCQDCHMNKNNAGHLMPAYRENEIARSAVDIHVDTVAYRFLLRVGASAVPTVILTVSMTNNAGHRIPDG
ncbi:MAG: multiheme c-type cytochrome (seleno)protein ExtKL [Thermodesulfovibrionales bacterium]